MTCKSGLNPNNHVGPITYESFSGQKHWFCLACQGSVDQVGDALHEAMASLTAAIDGYSVNADSVDVNDLYDAATKAILDRDSSAVPNVARADAIAVVDVVMSMLEEASADETSPTDP